MLCYLTMVENSIIQPKATCLPEEKVKWSVVELIVEGYTARFPEEVMGCAEYVKQKKAEKGALNDYALMEGKMGDGANSDRRYMYELPSRLKTALEIKYPSVLKGTNLTKFLKKYSIFCIPDKL